MVHGHRQFIKKERASEKVILKFWCTLMISMVKYAPNDASRKIAKQRAYGRC